MGIFSAKTGLRSQYLDMAFTQLNATNNATDAYYIGELKTEAKISFIDNGTNADIVVYLVHPEADSSVPANRLKWIEIGSNKIINMSSILASLAMEPGTKMFISRATPPTAASAGKVRIYVLG